MPVSSFTVRPVVADDLPFMWDMIWEAAAVDAGVRAMGRDAAIQLPSIRKYVEGWGREGDGGVIAVDAAGDSLGAAWYRLFPAKNPGYGFVAADIPELSIGVVEHARGRSVGGSLLDALNQMAKASGYRALCLSVDRANPAISLYGRHGFVDAGISPETDTSVTMINRF